MKRNLFYLLIWRIFGKIIFRIIPTNFFKLRVLILKVFGSKISWDCIVYPSSDIYSPKNLIMDSRACLSYKTIVYNVAPVFIGKNSCISQFSFLCTASHDINDKFMKLKKTPIFIGNNVWIGADCYINRGCKINNNAVVAARSTIYKNVNSSEVVSSTMKHSVIKLRKIFD